MKKNSLGIIFILVVLLGCKKEEVSYDIYVEKKPSKTYYFENDILDLSGLVVYLHNSEGKNEEIAFEDFEKKNLISEPANGEALLLANNTIKISHTASGSFVYLDIKIEPIEVTLKGVEQVCETPFSNPRTCIVYSDYLYVASSDLIYRYNFAINQWSVHAQVGIYDWIVLTSFIRENKWWYISSNGGDYRLSYFDFETLEIVQVSDLVISSHSVGAHYEKDELYFYEFSDSRNNNQELFRFDFGSKEFVIISDYHGIMQYNFPEFKECINFQGKNYLLTGISNIDIYEFNEVDYIFELQASVDYPGKSIVEASFVYGNYIVFGFGGTASVDSERNYSSKWYGKGFRYYNPITQKGGRVKNGFYEGRYNVLIFDYDDEIYLLGGVAVPDSITRPDQKINRNLLEKLIFE